MLDKEVSEAINLLDDAIHKTRSPAYLKANLRRVANSIGNRPYNPILNHTLRYVLRATDIEHTKSMREQALEHVHRIKSALSSAKNHAVESGVMKIAEGSSVATSGNNPLIRDILLAAKKKKISVHVTEADNGRDLAHQLSSKGMNATLYPDAAARLALRDSDILLLGCTAITPNTIIAPMGSELLAEVARMQGIPVYVAALALQFDPRAENHVKKLKDFSPRQVRQDPATGITHNKARFEFIDPEKINGIISELGIYDHRAFVEEVYWHHPWMIG